MANIKVTPEELRSQGQALQGFSEETQSLLQRVASKIAEIDGGWDGLAQSGYLEMYNKMNESLKQMPELLSALSQATIGAADAFSQVDEQLSSSFAGKA